MRLRIGVLFAACLAVALVLFACSSPGASSSSSTTSSSTGGSATSGTTITEQNFAFNPATATVKVGDTVTFVNKDSATHNVKIDGQELGAQNQGESKTWTASKAGSFPYNCVIHPSMTGEITVK